ncbi:MAG: hypothetical protein SGPRY_014459, partial [Prymnesium sp.]
MLRLILVRENCTLSVDLEGKLGGSRSHIALLQACIDGIDLLPPLQFVFDIHRVPRILRAGGPCTLRELLENPRLTKIFPCCRGGADALYSELSIAIEGVFDSGVVVDYMLLRRPLNKPRKHDVVLHHWLGEESSPLQHISSMVFVEKMFEARPLPLRLFTYAIEDVIYCNKLGSCLLSALQEDNSLEMGFSLQPLTPHRSHSATFFAAALVSRLLS